MVETHSKRRIYTIVLIAATLAVLARGRASAQETAFVLHSVPFNSEHTVVTPITVSGLTLGDSPEAVERELHALDANFVVKIKKSRFSMGVGGKRMVSGEYVSMISAMTRTDDGFLPAVSNYVDATFGLPTTGNGLVAFSITPVFNKGNQIDSKTLVDLLLTKYGPKSYGFYLDPQGKRDDSGHNPGDLDFEWVLGHSGTLPCRDMFDCVANLHEPTLDRLSSLDQDVARGVVVFLGVSGNSFESDRSKLKAFTEFVQDVATEARSLHEAVRQATEAAKASGGR